MRKNRGEELGAPLALEPDVGPVPLASTPGQAQNAPVTKRAPNGPVANRVSRRPKNCSVKINRDLALPGFGDERLVLPERLEDLGVEADVARFLQALQLLFALDEGLAFPYCPTRRISFPLPEHVLQPDFGKIQLP